MSALVLPVSTGRSASSRRRRTLGEPGPRIRVGLAAAAFHVHRFQPRADCAPAQPRYAPSRRGAVLCTLLPRWHAQRPDRRLAEYSSEHSPVQFETDCITDAQAAAVCRTQDLQVCHPSVQRTMRRRLPASNYQQRHNAAVWPRRWLRTVLGDRRSLALVHGGTDDSKRTPFWRTLRERVAPEPDVPPEQQRRS